MDCLCELIFNTGNYICKSGSFLSEHAAYIGLFFLFAICIIIYVDRVSDPEQLLEVRIEGPNNINIGETAHLKGQVLFSRRIKYIKWKKYQNGEYLDINIHKTKYYGSKNQLESPTLEIHDVDAEDELPYILEVDTGSYTVFSNSYTLKVLRASEKPRIQLLPDEMNFTYYVGEDITVNAHLENQISILCVTWQKKTDYGIQVIDTTLPKYEGTTATVERAILRIRDCVMEDTGVYFLLAAGFDDIEIYSEEIHFSVVKDQPSVSPISFPREAPYHESVEFKAKIRSFPKHSTSVWMKDSNVVDLSDPKYEGSTCDGDHPVLRISKVTEEDEAVYRIQAKNELGEGCWCSKKLKVIAEIPEVKQLKISIHSQPLIYGNTIILEADIVASPKPTIQWKKNGNFIHSNGKFVEHHSNVQNPKLKIDNVDFDDNGAYSITATNVLGSATETLEVKIKVNQFLFISGPVVVSSQNAIQFKTVYPSAQSNGRWIKTQRNTGTEIEDKLPGYTILTSGSIPRPQKLIIENAKENVGTYQLCFGSIKSNKITVFIDDYGYFSSEEEANCLRYFALQTVSKEALIKILDRQTGSFQVKWNKFYVFCNSPEGEGLKSILPKLTPSSSKELDISVMYAMFRNTLKLIPPTLGWGKNPRSNHTTETDDIERIRRSRNLICHSKSSEMTTKDFNDSSLELIQVIQRLSSNDQQLIEQISKILSQVFYKGTEMNKMMEDLEKFRQHAEQTEDILQQNEDVRDGLPMAIEDMASSAIHLTGRTKLYIGETALFIAFIDSKISSINKVFWRKRDKQGHVSKINIKNGKYIGSKIELPSPELCVHFVRKEDEGIYDVVVETFNKSFHGSINLNVEKGECDDKDEIADGNEDIGFHPFHDSNISLLHNGTIARKINGEDKNGVCYMNRPMKIGEDVYIHVTETYAKWSSSMDFGLTNKNPATITEERKRDTDEEFNYLPDYNDVLCLCLNRDATLSFCINDIRQPARKLKHVSVQYPVWLVLDLYGKTTAIKISTKKIKTKPYNSFFREYSY